MARTQSRTSAEAPPAKGDDDSSPMIVSTDMFLFYGQSLEQCVKLSTGQVLYDLSSMHKSGLASMQVGSNMLVPCHASLDVTEEVLTVQSKRYVAFHTKVTRADAYTS